MWKVSRKNWVVEGTTIPLMRPDLTTMDRDALAHQLGIFPFQDERLVMRWELAWSQLWGRKAILFDDPVDCIVALKGALGWRDGDRIAVGAGMHPAWREGFDAAWMRVVYHDQDPWERPNFPAGGDFVGVMMEHFQGVVVPVPTGSWVVLEDISSMPAPLPGTGRGDIQLMVLDGNAMIQGGNAGLVMCRDERLMARLQAHRRYPSALMARVGLSQLEQMYALLNRRSLLASRYLALRTGGWFFMAPGGCLPRWWHGFTLMFHDPSRREGLRKFLHKGNIQTGSPWSFSCPEVQAMVGRRRLEGHGLTLPLYASLSDAEQKKIINRIHRWVGRGGPL
ncbi:MAG: hypothetical protein HQL75_13305 [Magnetococcales bacterium]|nr:hypothetical protein [Magnetococcales bacterium]